MADLYDQIGEEVQSDDENYIFINEHGQAELKQQQLFKWFDFPSKQFHLLCGPNDSLSYIKTLLTVQLEKFSLFFGLKSAKISKLFTLKETLPDKGTIAGYLKPDQAIFFEVIVSELWLEVQVDLKDLNSFLFFEVKISMETKVGVMKKIIVEIMNSALASQEGFAGYDEGMVEIKKIVIGDENFFEYEMRGMILSQQCRIVTMSEVDCGGFVKDCFDIKNRFLYCSPAGKKILINGKSKRSDLRSIFYPSFIHVLQNQDFGYFIRNPRIEMKSLLKITKSQAAIKRKPTIKEEKSEACNCFLF